MLYESYYGVNPQDYYEAEYRTSYVAGPGQTIFPANFAIGMVDVFRNGSHLEESEFDSSSGTQIVIPGAKQDDTISIVSRRQVPTTLGAPYLPGLRIQEYDPGTAPAASSEMDGKILILKSPNPATTQAQIVFYTQGQRYYLSGTIF